MRRDAAQRQHNGVDALKNTNFRGELILRQIEGLVSQRQPEVPHNKQRFRLPRVGCRQQGAITLGGFFEQINYLSRHDFAARFGAA